MSAKVYQVRLGVRVRWEWEGEEADGIVKAIYDHPVTKTLQGHEITRNGSPPDPVILIEEDDGTQLLKLRSELRQPDEK